VQGGPSSSTVLYATEKFRKENPKTYRAFTAALAEAADYAAKNPEGAADIYLRTNKSKVDRAILVKIFRNPEVQFKISPQNTLTLAQFMHRVGAIKNKPESWRDYFFDDPAIGQGG
jgi:NitT/TauT family transport system substrate-binding protein